MGVGAGGNLGSVIALRSFFFEGDIRRDEGFLRLGAMVIGLTALMFFIYFPDMGSLLTPAGALGSYDPQLIKPPADYRGADHMDFSAVKATSPRARTSRSRRRPKRSHRARRALIPIPQPACSLIPECSEHMVQRVGWCTPVYRQDSYTCSLRRETVCPK